MNFFSSSMISSRSAASISVKNRPPGNPHDRPLFAFTEAFALDYRHDEILGIDTSANFTDIVEIAATDAGALPAAETLVDTDD